MQAKFDFKMTWQEVSGVIIKTDTTRPSEKAALDQTGMGTNKVGEAFIYWENRSNKAGIIGDYFFI